SRGRTAKASRAVSSWSYQSRHRVGISRRVGRCWWCYCRLPREEPSRRSHSRGFPDRGWVAMWRPLEVFLYDWWPIRADARLLQRLSTMPVRIEYNENAPADAWQSDWPEVAPAEKRTSTS